MPVLTFCNQTDAVLQPRLCFQKKYQNYFPDRMTEKRLVLGFLNA